MALFADGGINTWEDLRRYESSILDVASTEGIEIDPKLRLAQNEIGVELSSFLFRNVGDRQTGRVVVTEALAQWHAAHTLSLIYRDSYNSQLNDRYKGKWHEYVRLSEWAREKLWEIGVGLVSDPLGRPGAFALTDIAGGALPETTYYVSGTWQNALGAESAPSLLQVLRVDAGRLLQMTPPPAPANAVGWNVFAGTADGWITRQNSTVMPVTAVWTSPGAGLAAGTPCGSGQAAEIFVTRRRAWPRG